MEEPIDAEKKSEEIRVCAWRAEQLGNLGISSVTASRAAKTVDWHDVADLVQKGCPPELALDIAR